MRRRDWFWLILCVIVAAAFLGQCAYVATHCDGGKVVRGVVGTECVDRP